MNKGVVASVVAALLVAAAVAGWLAVRGGSSAGNPEGSSTTTTQLPDPPEDWPPIDTTTATAVKAFLSGDGKILVDLRDATAPASSGLNTRSCDSAVAAINRLDAGDALTKATGVPDAPLSDMFVNLTGQANEIVVACSAGDDDASISADLVTTDSFIAVRLEQVEKAA